MDTKVYMVTGVTSALGKAVALELAKTGETVIMVARDADRGRQVEEEIAAATQNPNLDMQLCDMFTISSVRNLATVVTSRYDQIHALINNSSLYARRREVTLDGLEKMFAANHLSSFLLTYMLLERLQAADSARIINITSPSTARLDFDDLQSEGSFNPFRAFNATKMANLLFTFELARRLENTPVTVNAYHPGMVRASSIQESPQPMPLLTWLFSSPPNAAAQDIVRLATALDLENTHGKFLHKGEEIQPDASVLDPENQERLWEISERLTKAPEQGPNYDPTGSKEMYDEHKEPPPMIQK